MTEITSIATRGSAGQVNISLTQSQNMRIPLPPLNEVERIINEVVKYDLLIEAVEYETIELQALIISIKSKILDLAIHGKLVPQDSNDEPALNLLKRINPDFTPCDNGQYKNIPKNWYTCKLVDICSFLSRGKSPKYSEDDKTYPVFAQKCNLKDGDVSLEQARFLDLSTINKWNEVYKLQTGDILVNSTFTLTFYLSLLFNSFFFLIFPFFFPSSLFSFFFI